MAHELETVTVTVKAGGKLPAGMTIGEAQAYIKENGAVIHEGIGIASALEFLQAGGFGCALVMFNTARGAMAMDAIHFRPWAMRMTNLIASR